jgi:hypothetical protein
MTCAHSRNEACASWHHYCPKKPPPLTWHFLPNTRAEDNSASHAAGSSQESSTRASRAGRLRGVVGSGSTGYVRDKLSPSSKPGSQSFSSAELFLPHPSQQVQWHSVTTVTHLVLGCTPPYKWPYGPLSGAVKYPAGARPSKCIIIIIILL